MFVHRKGIKDIYQVMSEDTVCPIIKAMFMVRSRVGFFSFKKPTY